MSGRWWLITLGVLAGILLAVGPQEVGLLVGGYVLLRGRRAVGFGLLFGLVVGLAVGWREQRLQAVPPVPLGEITVMPADWTIRDHFIRYSGRAANGVWTSGSAEVDDETLNKLQEITQPAVVTTSKPAQRLPPARNLFEFDFSAYAWAQNRQAYQFPTQSLIWQPRPARGVIEWLAGVRVGLLRRLEGLPTHVRRYAKGLLLGIVDDDFDALRGAFVDLGIFHLFSVSGLHLFALIGALYWLSDRLRIPSEAIDWAVIGLLPMLLIIIPPGAGILRAVWMRVLVSVSARLGFALTMADGFWLVLLGNLVWQPLVLHTFGGQMTYLLTGVLILLPPLGSLAIAWRLFAVGLPVVLAHTFKIHVLGGWFNWLLMPLFELAIMPGLVLVSVWPTTPLTGWLETTLTGLEKMLVALAALPGLVIFGAVAAPLAVLGVLAALVGSSRSRWGYLLSWLGGAYLLANWQPTTRVVVFDVGQGDAILIEGAHKSGTMLIDTGGRLFGQVRNPPATRVIVNYLHARGIAKLDTLVVSHPDADHVGDAAVLTRQIPVTTMVTTPLARDDPAAKAALAGKVADNQLRLAGTNVEAQAIQLRVVAPADTKAKDKNADSIVLYGKIGDGNWLFTGDTDAQIEREQLIPQALAVDYLKVAHHGSKTASSPAFIEAIHPQAAFISSGVANRYGHPHAETLATFERAGVPWWNTADKGMIWIDMTTDTHQIHTMLKE